MTQPDPDSTADNNPFWRFCKTVYAKPGVEDVLLALQDEDGADVLMLLFCCWVSSEGRTFERALPAALVISDAFQSNVTTSVRRARRKFKDLPETLDFQPGMRADAHLLRVSLKDLELNLEALQSRALAALVPVELPHGEGADQALLHLVAYFTAADLPHPSDTQKRLETLVELIQT